MNENSGYIDPTTIMVSRDYNGRWGVRAFGARDGEFPYDEWWIGDHGLPYSPRLDEPNGVILFLATKEEAERMAERLMGMEGAEGWNDHE